MTYLFMAYSVIWLVLFAYLLSLSRKQRKLSQELETLRKLLAENR